MDARCALDGPRPARSFGNAGGKASPAEKAARKRARALGIARELLALAAARAVPVTEIFHASDPGPDFSPRPWRW